MQFDVFRFTRMSEIFCRGALRNFPNAAALFGFLSCSGSQTFWRYYLFSINIILPTNMLANCPVISTFYGKIGKYITIKINTIIGITK